MKLGKKIWIRLEMAKKKKNPAHRKQVKLSQGGVSEGQHVSLTWAVEVLCT